MDKQEKTDLYLKHQEYISFLVYNFLQANPTFIYLREDLEAECALKFLTICDKYDGERAKFTTFLYDQLKYYMLNFLAREIQISTGELAMAEDYRRTEILPEEDDYYGFEELLKEGECTPLQKKTLRLYFIQEKTEQEIADIQGIARQNVNKCVHRALARMRKKVKR